MFCARGPLRVGTQKEGALPAALLPSKHPKGRNSRHGRHREKVPGRLGRYSAAAQKLQTSQCRRLHHGRGKPH